MTTSRSSRPICRRSSRGRRLVRNLFLSLDPYMRPRMDPIRSYVDPLKPGDLMPGATVGEVIDSKAEDLPKGTLVGTFLGWQTHGIVTKAGVRVIDRALGSPSNALGVLGMTGVTAHYGMLALAKPKPGETVVVTAASGAVGSIAGQIAKLKGCRVVGIAGGPAKCRYVVDELGFDACIDYRAADFEAQLAAATPEVCRCAVRERGRPGARCRAGADQRSRAHRVVRQHQPIQCHRAVRPQGIAAHPDAPCDGVSPSSSPIIATTGRRLWLTCRSGSRRAS